MKKNILFFVLTKAKSPSKLCTQLPSAVRPLSLHCTFPRTYSLKHKRNVHHLNIFMIFSSFFYFENFPKPIMLSYLLKQFCSVNWAIFCWSQLGTLKRLSRLRGWGLYTTTRIAAIVYISSGCLKSAEDLVDCWVPGCKQNLKNETKQSGPKREYDLNRARSGALL